jgi:hypothetical protein
VLVYNERFARSQVHFFFLPSPVKVFSLVLSYLGPWAWALGLSDRRPCLGLGLGLG